ncbi:ATP synthase subunit I [Paenarthrobacter sp. NPDC091669]|uniref:ATP synthase subunit I n=1 Tax=Paenarthrobacter sp. NPDC091669 TaxID=3364384 RepID=UPI0037F52FD7
MSKVSFTSKRAPIHHYVLAVILGAILTITVALLVGASNSGDFWLAAGIGALCAAYPAMSLGIKVFVSRHTVTRDQHGEQSVELQWMRQAGAGAFLDVLVAIIVAALVLAVGRFEIDALPVLVGLIGLSAVDAGLRYVAIRHRALK